MTVAELVEKLKEFPQELEVFEIDMSEYGEFYGALYSYKGSPTLRNHPGKRSKKIVVI